MKTTSPVKPRGTATAADSTSSFRRWAGRSATCRPRRQLAAVLLTLALAFGCGGDGGEPGAARASAEDR